MTQSRNEYFDVLRRLSQEKEDLQTRKANEWKGFSSLRKAKVREQRQTAEAENELEQALKQELEIIANTEGRGQQFNSWLVGHFDAQASDLHDAGEDPYAVETLARLRDA